MASISLISLVSVRAGGGGGGASSGSVTALGGVCDVETSVLEAKALEADTDLRMSSIRVDLISEVIFE